MRRTKPKIIEQVGFDFHWDEKKVWALDLPTKTISIDDLKWHLDVPFLWSKPHGYYDLRPTDVLALPDQHAEEFVRTMESDLSYPIDIMWWRSRWVILDGLHRLMKASYYHSQTVQVRVVDQANIKKIQP